MNSKTISKPKRVGVFDSESDGLLPEATRVHCAVVKELTKGENEGVVTRFTPDNIHDLCRFLDGFDVLIGHNVIWFDFPLFRKIFGWEFKGTKVDTLWMSRIQRPNRIIPPHMPNRSAGPHSIEAWGYRVGRGKVEYEDWSTFTPTMLTRCEEDVEINHLVYLELLKEGNGEGWRNAHIINNKLFHYLQKQEEYGWMVDHAHMEKSIRTLGRWIDRIDRGIIPRLPWIAEPGELRKAGEYNFVRKPFLKNGCLTQRVSEYFSLGADDQSSHCCRPIDQVAGPFSRVSFRQIDISSNKETKQFLLDSGWEPKEWNVDSDGRRTSPKLSKDDDFLGVQGSLGRLLAKRVQCRQRRGILEGWKEIIRPDGRISTAINGIATTGRLKHKGIVNVPSPDANAFFAKEMRSVFIAQPGWVLVGADSKSNQMRQLAARLMAAFPPDGDKEFTYAVLHGTKEDGTDLHSLNQRRSGVDTRTKAKNFFYGCILFGAGNAKTAKVTGKSVEEARLLKEEYFDQMPMLRDFLEMEREKWRKTAKKYFNPAFNRMEYRDGWITGLDGRRVSVEFEKDILVYYLQSDEAIQMAYAYVWANEELERRGYKWGKDYGFCIWYHDEFQVECRPEIAKVVQEVLEESIAWAGRHLGILCPHEGDSKVGRSWCDTH